MDKYSTIMGTGIVQSTKAENHAILASKQWVLQKIQSNAHQKARDTSPTHEEELVRMGLLLNTCL